MKHPFPVRRTDTITRANVETALREFGDKLVTAEDMAVFFVGKESLVKPRHVNRCAKLMRSR